MRYVILGGIAAFALACTPVLASQMTGSTGMNSMHMPKCAAGNPVVWVNTGSNTYFMKGERYYGKTKSGSFVCRNSAMAMHAHRAMMGGKGMMHDTMKSGSMSSGMSSGSMKPGSMSPGSMSPGSMSSPGAMGSMSPGGAPKPYPTNASPPNAGGSAPPTLPNNPASMPAPKPSPT